MFFPRYTPPEKTYCNLMHASGEAFADNEGDGDMPRTYSELYISVRNRLRDAGIEAAELEGKLIVATAA